MNERLLIGAVVRGVKLCACSRPAVRVTAAGPACAVCLRIEARSLHREPPMKRRPPAGANPPRTGASRGGALTS